MHTKPASEIASSELKAVREFLTSLRTEERQTRAPHLTSERGTVPLRNGIARARMRSATKPQA